MFRFANNKSILFKNNNLNLSAQILLKKSNTVLLNNLIKCLLSSKNNTILKNKHDFASRHIGPRNNDIASMLDSLGFRVVINI